MAVRIDLRIAQNGRDAILETLRDEVLQALRFVVNLVPGVLQDIMQEKFQETVMTHQLPGAMFPCRRQTNSMMLFVLDQRRALNG
jgi:hypothetical protein